MPTQCTGVKSPGTPTIILKPSNSGGFRIFMYVICVIVCFASVGGRVKIQLT